MKNFINLLILILFFFSFNLIKAQDINWNLRKNSNGITIHTRKIEKTGIVEFKAEMIVNKTIDSVLNIVTNTESYTQWMSNVIVSKTLKIINENEKYIYLVSEVPWPLKNRDMPFYQKIIKSKKIIKITLAGISNYTPPIEGIKRITKKLTGLWILIPISDKQVKIIYQSSFYPGPTMPNWILRLFTVDGAYKTLIELRELI